MSLKDKFPSLYECDLCGKSVKVIPQDIGVEPIIKRSCKCPEDTMINARRKVTLRGKGNLSELKKAQIKITLTLRQFLSALTGRSI